MKIEQKMGKNRSYLIVEQEFVASVDSFYNYSTYLTSVKHRTSDVWCVLNYAKGTGLYLDVSIIINKSPCCPYCHSTEFSRMGSVMIHGYVLSLSQKVQHHKKQFGPLTSQGSNHSSI